MEVLDLVLYMTRSYAYGLHRRKLILTGKWPYSFKNPDCYFAKNFNFLTFSFAGTLDEPVDKNEYDQYNSLTSTAMCSPVTPAAPPDYLFRTNNRAITKMHAGLPGCADGRGCDGRDSLTGDFPVGSGLPLSTVANR